MKRWIGILGNAGSESRLPSYRILLDDGFECHELNILPSKRYQSYSLEMSSALDDIVRSTGFPIEQHLNKLDNINEFVNVLEDQLLTWNNLFSEKSKSMTSRSNFRQDTEIQLALSRELSKMCWENVLSFDPEKMELLFEFSDDASRNHEISVSFKDRFPHKNPRISMNIPETQDVTDFSQSLENLPVFLNQILNLYQNFWNEMDELDDHLCIAQPRNITRSVASRKIRLGECFIKLEVADPKNPRSLPIIQIIGPLEQKDKIREHQAHYSNKAKEWNTSSSIRENLTLIFPELSAHKHHHKHAETDARDSGALEDICGICYLSNDENLSSKFRNSSFVCDDCSNSFHMDCIVDWVQTLPDTRRSFNRLFSQCPYCNSAIMLMLEK